MNYTFTFKDKEYVLSKENCEGIFFNDDEIENFNLELILDILINSDEVDFSKEFLHDTFQYLYEYGQLN